MLKFHEKEKFLHFQLTQINFALIVNFTKKKANEKIANMFDESKKIITKVNN